YFLIGRYGGAGAPRAALKFLLYNLSGGLLMLVALIGLNLVCGTFDSRAIVAGMSSGDIVANPDLMHLLFLGFLLAF
ncbi:NADH-quinone oxidoreductase subunit M, partial [Mycobacterium kansasii]